MTYQNIQVTLEEDGIGMIIIDRPEVLNAIDTNTWEEIREGVKNLDENPEIGVIIITGSGEKAFAAGSDISQIKERGLIDGLKAVSQLVLADLETIEKPIIAAVNGFALGGGCELSLACDIRIASKTAKFGQPEVNLAIIPGAGGTQRLATLIGIGRAKELILTGDIIDADEAYRIGLVNHVVEPSELIEKSKEIARKILSKGPMAIRLAKISLNAGSNYGTKAGMIVERLAQSCLMTTHDKNEGTAAFLEKRKADFKNQ